MMLARNTGKALVDVSTLSGKYFHQVWVGRHGHRRHRQRWQTRRCHQHEWWPILRNETETANPWLALKLVGQEQLRLYRRGGEGDHSEGLALGHGYH